MSDDELFIVEASESEARPIRTPTEAKKRLGGPTSHTPKLSDILTTPDLKGGMHRFEFPPSAAVSYFILCS